MRVAEVADGPKGQLFVTLDVRDGTPDCGGFSLFAPSGKDAVKAWTEGTVVTFRGSCRGLWPSGVGFNQCKVVSPRSVAGPGPCLAAWFFLPSPRWGEGLGVRGVFLPSPRWGEGLGVRGVFLPSPRWGEGLGVRGGPAPREPASPHPQPLSPAGRGEED